jgi:Novel STAND NTPase 1
MNEPRRTFDERLKAISGTLGVLIGLLALVPQFSKNISEAVDAVIKLPQIVWYLVPVLLLIVGMLALRDGLARRSRLLRPEALILKADHPEHLKGREEDIDRLSALCDEYQQVNLVGESGAGKSALIQAGLCPALKANRGLFPIYLNIWGEDWQEGPRFALTQELGETLSEEERRALGLTAPPEPEDLVSILEQFRAKLGRTPLLIFDQFDDYQTRHRAHFLTGRRRTWLPASRLIEANAFWRDIKQVIDNHAVHCLCATRTDAADGLGSVRFVEPRVYPLDRLHAASVLPLLTELTANTENPSVFAPDRGWERLKGRLARDLTQDGAVLPVQMKMVLQGLASLGSLTVRDYERAGRLHGLEAAHVERHVASTALHSGLTRGQVQTLLTSLADTETLKTVPRSTTDLEKAITAGDETNPERIEGDVNAGLDALQTKEIIRKRLDPDTRQHVWVLDDDYLCRGVLEAERRANRWFILAQEGYRAFQDAGSNVWRTWRSLLSPWQQIVLMSQRLRGRFHYGTLYSYACWSLCRFVPYLLVLAAVIYGWIDISQR